MATCPISKTPHEHVDKFDPFRLSFVTIGVLFLWDVHVIGAQAQRLLYYSHDEFGWISA